MTLEFKEGRSLVYPELLDTTSSSVVNYIRKDVEEVEVEDEMTGETRTEYKFLEATPTKQEYEIWVVKQAASTDNTMNQEAIAELAELQEEQFTAMEEAIAELAESLVE